VEVLRQIIDKNQEKEPCACSMIEAAQTWLSSRPAAALDVDSRRLLEGLLLQKKTQVGHEVMGLQRAKKAMSACVHVREEKVR
jgi:hypothetical protein